MKFLSSFLFIELVFICGAELTAQSFWKGYGEITDTIAWHSGLLYSRENNSLFVSTYNMGIFKGTRDSTWLHVLTLPKDQPILSLYESKNGYLFAGGLGKIFRSDPPGEKWMEVPLNFTYVKSFAEDLHGNLYLCSADSGGILQSTDNGLTWKTFVNGLPTNYVTNLISDGHGNILCTLDNDRTDVHGGLFYLNPLTNQWIKKNITVELDNVLYSVKVNSISSLTITPGGIVYLSLDGGIMDFALFGIFKNSVSGILAGSVWEPESWNETGNSPITLRFDQIFASQAGHIFSSRISSSTPGVYSKMKYSSKWIDCNGGLSPAYRVKSYFTEGADGTIYITSDFSNRIFLTKESIPGKKPQNIEFDELAPARLYEYATLNASSSSGLTVHFTSMNTDRARIERNRVQALGLGVVVIKAYADGNDTWYYNEESQVLTIDKASNEIYIEPLPDQTEGGNYPDVIARATSGEAVRLAVTHGNAWFEGTKIYYEGAGRIIFMATEEGNNTYEAADTVWMEFCINPNKPFILSDTLSGNVRLSSTGETGNRWYLNNSLLGHEDKILTPVSPGIYTVQVDIEGCFSPVSEPYYFLVTDIKQSSPENPFIVYPQPSHGRLFIKHRGVMTNEPVRITLMDSRGNTVLSQEENDQNIISTDVRELPPGLYVLEFSAGDKTYYVKIILN
jgi:hypothetical protein